MDVTFNNVLEGTRQYFLGLPKQAQTEGSGQPVWPADVSPPEEGAPAQSGAPAPLSRPPSAAAAPPSTPSTVMAVAIPPRPPSEPLEPEPHIIHKATVMREAAEKRRERPQEDEEESIETLSPPSHIIRKPPRTLPSPAPAPAAPCPSPARPPSTVPLQQPPAVPEQQLDNTSPYRTPVHRVPTPTVRPSDHYAPGRPPDAYSTPRPPDPYMRYHYEPNHHDGGRNSHGPPAPSPQPAVTARQSPQTYARISSSLPQHSATRLREAIPQSPPTQRYVIPASQPPPPHNDRVPPIHHPQIAQPPQRLDVRSTQAYSPLQQCRDSSPYGRLSSHYERQSTVPPRKYDPQQAYPGYRPTPITSQPIQNHRIETHHPTSYKQAAIDVMNSHYTTRPPDRAPVAAQIQSHDATRVPTRGEYLNINRPVDTRSSYPYPTPSTSTARYGSTSQMPGIAQNSTNLQQRTAYRSSSVQKPNYDFSTSSSVQTSPARSTVKSGYPNQQARMTVSVTTLVNQMNQTKQKQDVPVAVTPSATVVNSAKHKRESPLDLSVKTVKNSADSSTTQDDSIDSASIENKTSLQVRPPSSSSRHNVPATASYISSHKVDFAPNFTQYRDRNIHHGNVTATAQNSHSIRFNGAYEPQRPVSESYPAESQQHTYPERNKYSNTSGRIDYVSRIDLTRAVSDQRLESRREDRSYVDDRKRLAGPINSNIPEKLVRYETWTSDSRMSQFAREQHDLISRPVYSYSSHKQFEAYQNEQKRPVSISYRDHHSHANHRYSTNQYPSDLLNRDQNDRGQYHDRSMSNSNRHQVIQKLPHHRETQQLESHSGIPADKRVLSILRNSLETKHTGYTEPVRQPRQVPDLIVIDDVDDSVIEITDLTKDSETESTVKSTSKNSHTAPNSELNIQMPKAVDSIISDTDKRIDNLEVKGKSPENDVASRIRTKAELKVMPPSHENNFTPDIKHDTNIDKIKVQPKSQKQHLFNQIREDQRLESVIKSEKVIQNIITEVKTEPMNIDEIEKDAEVPIKDDSMLKNLELDNTVVGRGAMDDDLDWANACDSFMEQLKDGCHKKKIRKRMDTLESEIDKLDTNKYNDNTNSDILDTNSKVDNIPSVIIKQEPIDDDEIKQDNIPLANILTELDSKNDATTAEESLVDEKVDSKTKIENKIKTNSKQKNTNKKGNKDSEKIHRNKNRTKVDKTNKDLTLQTPIKKEIEESIPLQTKIKEELESTDDDEPLIKSKLLKEKERDEQFKYQLLKDLSEKSAYVKLECCDVDVNKNSRKSIECPAVDKNDKDDKQCKTKSNKQISRSKVKSNNDLNKVVKCNEVLSSDSEEDEHTVASRLRVRKNIKTDDNKQIPQAKSPVKFSTKKQESNTLQTNASSSLTPIRKPGFGDGSDFRPGWEEELYKYKRSLRMPTRLIAIPRGRSGGPFTKGSVSLFTRGSTSLPDLDPAPLSPAPSSAPSAATDDIYTRRQDKITLDSDLESNASYTAPNKLHYDSEASNSTVLSSTMKKKRSSIVDVLIQKCGRKDESKKKSKDKDDKTPKVIPKSSNTTELLATPSLGLMKTSDKGSLSAKKEKLMEDIFYLGAFRKETVTAFRNAFIRNTDGLIGATEEFAPVVLKSRTRTESRVLKQRATMKEVFGDERPASAPPTSCLDNETAEGVVEPIAKPKPKEPENKPKVKPKKIIKDKANRRSSSIRDGLRSTKSLKRNDAKGRLLRLKKRNSIMKSLSHKRLKDSAVKNKKENSPTTEDKTKEVGSSPDAATPEVNVKRKLKRLFGRRKFSSGFDYIRKKKKIIRKDDNNVNKNRRITTKPSPESIHDIHKEIKSWFINKSIGETHLHRATRLGYTDCVAYCLEKMEADPSAKDNAGFTPLHVAAAKGHVRIARLLLQYGANVSAAAQGGIRPLHEASENCHVEIIRLLLAYGADPLLVTYAGQTPEELAEGPAAKLIRLHISDVQGLAIEPWQFHHPAEIIDHEEIGCDPLSSPPPASPPPPPDSMIEIQCAEAPLPPFYTLRPVSGQPADGLWCLLQDITNLLQIKSKDSLLKQIHCGSGSPKELLREIRTQEFLERAQCHQLLCAGEKVNVRASKVALVRVTDKLRQLLKIETVLVS